MGGGGDKTDTNEDFKSLEVEMSLRQDGINYCICLLVITIDSTQTGMEKLHSSMNHYMKHLNRREYGEGKDRHTAVGHLGTTMVRHGEEFDDGSKFGECLIGELKTYIRLISIFALADEP